MLAKVFIGLGLIILPLMTIQSAKAQTPRNECTQFNQDFVIYFESNSAVVGELPEKIIAQALSNVEDKSATCAVSHVTVAGHTDSAGMAQKNIFLSHAMALNVKAALVDQGVDKRLIHTSGLGEEGQAKATRDNVREPLNRRTEVRIYLAPK